MSRSKDISEQLRSREYELNLLLETTNLIATKLDLNEVLSLVASKAREVIQSESLFVPIIDQDKKSYTYLAASGKNAELVLNTSIPINTGMCGWVLTHNKPLLFGPTSPWLMDKKTPWEKGMESALLVPLISRGQIVGGLSGSGKLDAEGFDQRDLELLTLFANQVSTIIENAQIFEELDAEKERAVVTLHSIGDAVITTDKNAKIEYMNPVAEKLTGWNLADAKDKNIDDIFIIFNELNNEPMESPVEKCLTSNSIVQLSKHSILKTKDNNFICIQDSAAPIHDRDKNIIGAVLVFQDITESRKMEKQVTYQATHDSLTGLSNRSEFERKLNEAIESARKYNSSHVLIYIDLDQFKIVNDTCGHIAGDELLKQVSKLILEKIRKQDLLARLGGDEFGLVLTDCNIDNGLKIAESIKDVIYNYSFVWKNNTFSIGLSMGLVPFTSDSDNYHGLMIAADSACYAAKEHGRNRINVYQPDDYELSKRKGEMRWIPRIKDAISKDNFSLYIQPIKAINTPDKNKHWEILLRMNSDNHDLIPPNAFIPAAERYNKMSDIDRWVIKHTIKKLTKNRCLDANCYSINISGQSLSEPDFLVYVKDMLVKNNIHTENICFEITETTAIANLTNALNFIKTLKNIGCKFSLDDFGSGLSSFAYLKNLPVDFLKIDGMFVKDILHDPIDLVMVEAITKVGHKMGMLTIAEFVENEAIAVKLEEIGVDYIQGFHIGRPCKWDLGC